MTDITYTYEIIAVDENARCMEIVYTSPTHGVMHVGARLPFEGETVEQVVVMFSPVREWRQREMAVVAPDVGVSGEITDAEPAPIPLADQVRAKRGYLLVASDWTQVADAPVDQAAWAEYRQALRDVPEQEGFPENVVWPTKPE
jgi:Phage tail assembly chaperone protein